jgi:hypothetical protein
MMKSRRLPESIGIMLNNVLLIVGGGLAHVLTVSRHHPSYLVAIKDFLSVRAKLNFCYRGDTGVDRGAVSRQLSLFASDIALPLRLGRRPQIPRSRRHR